MWRAFFLGVGISLCILGVECLFVHRAVLAAPSRPAEGQATASRNFEPPEWAPWSLMAGGAVVLIYSVSLRRPS